MVNRDDGSDKIGNSSFSGTPGNEKDLAPTPVPFENWLDSKLKSVYGSVLDEPIPSDILNLLRERLDQQHNPDPKSD